MLFTEKKSEECITKCYQTNQYYFKNALHAKIFTKPSASSDIYPKAICEEHEQWKRDFGIDCPSDIMYVVSDGESKLQIDERLRFRALSIVYDDSNCLIWIELKRNMWAAAFNELLSYQNDHAKYTEIYTRCIERLDVLLPPPNGRQLLKSQVV